MTRESVSWSLGALISLGLLTGSGLAAEAPGSAELNVTDPVPTAPRTVPRYVPPQLGAPDSRVSGATRGLTGVHDRLDVLAPPNVGLTVRQKATLY